MEDKTIKGRLLHQLVYGPWVSEPQKMSKEEWLAAIAGDIDPLKHAGEGWYATDEYARPSDISDPIVRSQIGKEDEYYPETERKKRRKK